MRPYTRTFPFPAWSPRVIFSYHVSPGEKISESLRSEPSCRIYIPFSSGDVGIISAFDRPPTPPGTRILLPSQRLNLLIWRLIGLLEYKIITLASPNRVKGSCITTPFDNVWLCFGTTATMKKQLLKKKKHNLCLINKETVSVTNCNE